MSVPTSRCEIDATSSVNRNSIGSSMVITCTGRRAGDVADHRRERRRLAAAGRAGDQHQPHRQVAELEQHRRQLEILEALDLVRDAPEAGRDVAALHVDVAAEAGEAAHAVAECPPTSAPRACVFCRGVRIAISISLELVRLERRRLDRQQPAVDAQQRRPRRLQMKVRRALVRHELQETIEIHDVARIVQEARESGGQQDDRTTRTLTDCTDGQVRRCVRESPCSSVLRS